MSCYHPIAAFPDYDAGKSETGNYRYKLSGAYHPEYKESLDPNVIKVPCGKCLGCRLDRARNWADRMILELESFNNKGIFVTLTYNNDNVPIACNDEGEVIGYTLSKRDFQLFFKRLRKHFPSGSVRYFACGEYGPSTHRPHMHAIIFGVGLDSFSDLREIGINELGQKYFSSEWLERIWKNGFICVSDVSYKTCSYVARYCMKKAFVDDEMEGLEPEFQIMSRNPGIGAFYYFEHMSDLAYSNIYTNDGNEHIKMALPKYFVNRLKKDRPDLYEKYNLADRGKYANDKELLELSRTSLSYTELRELDEYDAINKTKILFNLRKEL